MKQLLDKLFKIKISTSYMFVLFGISSIMLVGYSSYAWFTVQGVQQYSVVTGNLNGSIAIGANSVAINGSGVITYTPSTDDEEVTITITNSSDRTVKNSIYYYTLSDSLIKIGYTSDSAVPSVTGVTVLSGKTLTYKIKIKGAKGKQIKIGSSMGLTTSNLSLPSGTVAFELLSEPTAAETLIAKANPEDLDYNIATDAQKNQMWTFSHEATTQLKATTDYRYIGANPNNYVKFNDELWQIIGVFNVDDGTGKLEKRLKIISNDSMGAYPWDPRDNEWDYTNNNEWSTASLNEELNIGIFYSNLTDTAKKMIVDAKWYLGGVSNYDNSSNGLTSHFYSYERGTTVYSGRSTSWKGKVGLIYPSDYGYATSGDNTTPRATCLATEIHNWEEASSCYTNDWLFKSTKMWTLSPRSSDNSAVLYVYENGSVYDYNANGRFYNLVYPAVYLKPTIKVTTGTGSSTDPFILE